LGNQLFPSDNPWNQQITNAPVAADSATLVASIGASSPLHPDFGTMYAGAYNGIPYNVVSGTQAKVNVVVDVYPNESDLLPIPIPANAIIEGDPLPSSQNTGDRHMLVYDKDNNIVYETFGTYRPSEEPDNHWHAASEAVWDLSKDTFRTAGYTSADAAGLPILPGLVRPDEVLDQGKITHALRFTVPKSRNTWVYPASHEAGVNNAGLPPMGERFRLKASVDISQFSAADQVILQALKDYGMIVADNGSAWFLSGAPSSRWSDDDLHNLTQILGSDFEAVDLTPIVSSLGPTSGPAGTSVTINGLCFSGGAGMTQVFFGSTPATSIQVVSDTEIIANAPAGVSGTVDVTVQSPYGTSKVVAGDRFTFTRGSGTASQFQVSGPSGTTAGVSFSITISALDANNNPVPGYLGTVHFTSGDKAATVPANYTFTAADNGVHTFTGLVLRTAGTQSVAATDVATASITGSATISVSAAAASGFTVTGLVSPRTAGATGAVRVTALDPFGNLATSYRGTVHITSSDAQAGLPADYTFTAADAGKHSFTVILKTAGTQSVTATDTVTATISGQRGGVVVKPANAAVLVVSGFPPSATAGTGYTFTIVLEDAYGNVATGYRGTIRFSSSDASALLPANYTFKAADKGSHTFTATLNTRGTQSLGATDTINGSLTGMEMGITVV
jgi:hypothetical protein